MTTKKSVSQKMGIKKNSRAILINADNEAREAIDLPELNISSRLTGSFEYIHVFATLQKDLDKQFTRLKKHLDSGGMLWVSWPKGKQLDTDLDIKSVIKTGYDHGLVESKTLSINTIWSAIRFTHPKKGKTYKNSYGSLKPK